MPLTLYVDGPRWRAHLQSVADSHPGLIPVAKGNGYGLGVGRLARQAQRLGADTIAVGTYAEVAEVAKRFDGDIVVLEPWRPFLADLTYGDRLVHTVGRTGDLHALGRRADRPRVVLEGLTSMRRHGFTAEQLETLEHSASDVLVEGHALHFPMGEGHQREAERWLEATTAKRWYVSHLTDTELAALRQRHLDIEIRPRVGTALWLGDRKALTVKATVLDVHEIRRGERIGYRQRRVPKDGHVLIVSGGTAHGIGLEAPSSTTSTKHRAVALARGGLEAVGFAKSPYVVNGRRRWFVEPPHMQASMIFMPADEAPPEIGFEVEALVRFTTTHVDHVLLS